GVSADPLPRILKELRKKHEAVEVSVASGTSAELVKQILAGELDAAFVSLPVEARGIQTEVLSEDYLVAVASPRHRLAKQKVVSAFALAEEKLILGERGGNTRRLIDQFFAQAGMTPKNWSIRRRVFPPRSPRINFSTASAKALTTFCFANL